MRVTVKGQVTIPRRIREHYGLLPGSEVRFEEENGHVELVKSQDRDVWQKYRGLLKTNKTTDEILLRLRGPRP